MSSEAIFKTIEESIDSIKSNPALPGHVAIIMDGNGRWAAERSRPRVWGHQQGVASVRAVVEIAGELGIKVLTLFAFSEENWGRPKFEVNAIMKLLDTYMMKEKDALVRNNVIFRTIGDLTRLPKSTRERIQETQEILKDNTGLILNIAVSYGGRSEIVSACKGIAEAVKSGEMSLDDIDQKALAQRLFTKGIPDPDLVIRTSGEHRISNFLLWQIAYSELYYTPVHWPDFRKSHFLEAITTFLTRTRRFGLVGCPSAKLESSQSEC